MDKWKLSWCYAKNNLYHLVDTNRFGVMAVFSSFFMVMLYGCIGNYLRNEEITVSIFEMLPAILADGSIHIYLLVIILIFFSDAPFLRNGICHAVLRGTKKSWLLGQYIYIMIASVSMFCILWMIAIISCMPKLTFSSDWTPGFQTVIQNIFLIPSEFGIDITGTYSLAENPLIIFGKCFISFVLFSTFIGSVLFFFRFVVKGAWGYLIAASLYCMERLIDSMIDINAKWIEMYKISPFSVYKNFTNYRNISFGYAVVFFCVLIIIMYLLCCKEIKRIDLSKEDFHD